MPRGRKAKTWIDVYRDSETRYPPNTIGAVGLTSIDFPSSADSAFKRVVEQLVNLQATSPPKSSAEAVVQIRLRYVVCNFICRKFNIRPPFPLVDELGKPLKSSTLKYIKMLGAEATALFNLVSDVWGVRHPIGEFGSPAACWGAMMLEDMPTQQFFESDEFEELTKTKAVADFKHKTGQLAERVNPYSPHHRAHHMFFNIAVKYADAATGNAEDKYSIYARSYLPYLKARSELSAYMESKKSKTKMLKNKNRRI